MNIANVEKIIDYEFNNKNLLIQAFTRRAYAINNNLDYNNELLEFIGDRVLELSVTRYIINKYSKTDKYLLSNKKEGDFSKIKMNLVKKSILADRIEIFGLNEYIYMSDNEKKRINNETSIMEDLFEAIIGAIYLDSNYNDSIIDKIIIRLLNPNSYLDDISFEKELLNLCNVNNYKMSIKEIKTTKSPIYVLKVNDIEFKSLNKNNVYRKMYEFLINRKG